MSSASEPAWRAALRALPRPGADGLRILAGDFNGTLDHREMRRLLDAGYHDAADATGQGLRPTWPTRHGLPAPPLTIDHVLVDPRVRVRSVRVRDIPGSDHRAVVAELVLPRRGT
jgi:endonuclease/exonuclease/phosphatase family metal-dependent hydrolase